MRWYKENMFGTKNETTSRKEEGGDYFANYVNPSIQNDPIRIGGNYSKNYVNPIIPVGYKHVYGDWNNGFVIERSSDGSQFVWIPVGSLDPNGMLNGNSFSEKFGRRDYLNEFSTRYYEETLNVSQLESIKKYGGFYISRYNISKNNEGEPQSIKGCMPWTNISFEEAKKVAFSLEGNGIVRSHLPFGSEYDSILEWFIKSKARSREEIAYDSSNWGNFYNFCITKNLPIKIFETGSREEWCTNNIYDFAGNVDEWTQEQFTSYHIIRGGCCYTNGSTYSVAYRYYGNSDKGLDYTGFRATLLL